MPHSNLRMLAAAAAALAAVTIVAPACAADVEFASYTAVKSGTFAAKTSATTTKPGAVTLSETGKVEFSFLTTNLAPAINGVVADLVFTATGPSSDFTKAGGYGFQSGLDGSFTFTSAAAFSLGDTTYAAGADLLTVTFTDASLVTKLGGPTGFFSDDSGTGTVAYLSDFLTFPGLVGTDFSLGLTGASPVVPAIAKYLPKLSATLNGGFSADPGPVSNAIVPEPATWAMMLIGFVAIGMGVRDSARSKLHRPTSFA